MKGGARNRSGPQPDEKSARSEARGVTFTTLPADGYFGPVPDFPLMPFTVHRWEYEDKRRYQVLDEEATGEFHARERNLWEKVWTYPQAHAWAVEPWRWHTIAMWVRTAVVCESSEASAADKGAIHRFADQIGMTPAGLKENGWKIVTEDAAAAPTQMDEDDDPRLRLRSIGA